MKVGRGPAPRPRQGQPCTCGGTAPATSLRRRAPFALTAHGSARPLRAACPGRRLGYICGGRFRKCKKGFGKKPNPNPFFRTRTRTQSVSHSTLFSGGPLNGPPRQVVCAASWHNCRRRRQSGGSAPRPPFASGFGVRGSAPPCVGVVESPTQISSPNLPPIFGAPRQKNGSPKAPKSRSRKTMQQHRCCFGTAVPARLTRPPLVPKHGRWRAL